MGDFAYFFPKILPKCIFWIAQKAQTVRRESEKSAILDIIAPPDEADKNDDMSWYFNRSYDDPLDRLEGYENQVQQEYL